MPIAFLFPLDQKRRINWDEPTSRSRQTDLFKSTPFGGVPRLLPSRGSDVTLQYASQCVEEDLRIVRPRMLVAVPGLDVFKRLLAHMAAHKRAWMRVLGLWPNTAVFRSPFAHGPTCQKYWNTVPNQHHHWHSTFCHSTNRSLAWSFLSVFLPCRDPRRGCRFRLPQSCKQTCSSKNERPYLFAWQDLINAVSLQPSPLVDSHGRLVSSY